MENSKITSEDKVKIVSVTLMAVDIVVMLVLTGMSVLVLEFSRLCRAFVSGGEIPRALSFLGSILPGEYFIFVSIVSVVLVLKERYIPDKGVKLALNVLVAFFAMTYFLVCVVAVTTPLQSIINMFKEAQ